MSFRCCRLNKILLVSSEIDDSVWMDCGGISWFDCIVTSKAFHPSEYGASKGLALHTLHNQEE